MQKCISRKVTIWSDRFKWKQVLNYRKYWNTSRKVYVSDFFHNSTMACVQYSPNGSAIRWETTSYQAYRLHRGDMHGLFWGFYDYGSQRFMLNYLVCKGDYLKSLCVSLLVTHTDWEEETSLFIYLHLELNVDTFMAQTEVLYGKNALLLIVSIE